jgi:hypothetical protein
MGHTGSVGMATSTFPVAGDDGEHRAPQMGNPHVVLQLGMYFLAAASSENDQGSMNLASNTASLPATIPSRVAAIHGIAERLTWC